MPLLVRRLRAAVFVGAILGSIWLLGVMLLLLLTSDVTAPRPVTVALILVLALYPSLFWWKSRRDEPRWAVFVCDVLATLLQLGSAALLFVCARAAFRGAPTTTATDGLPMLASMATAWIAALSFAAVAAIQAHGYVTRRWPLESRTSGAPADLA